MHKFFYHFIIVLVCGCFFSCNKKKVPVPEQLSLESVEVYEEYFKPLFANSVSNDSALGIVRKIACDTTLRCSVSIVKNNESKLRSDSVDIAMAKAWCKIHPEQCNDFIQGRICAKEGRNDILI